MNGKPFDIIVVGQGAAGLAAALSAVEEARARDLPVAVTLIDKASADEAGGNTRWTPAYMRMAAPDRVEPSFVHDMLEATRFQGDESYFARLARDAPATVQWIAAHGVDVPPADLLSRQGPAAHPAGRRRRIDLHASSRAPRSDGGRRVPLRLRCARRWSARAARSAACGCAAARRFAADAVVLACGGFQGNRDMMREHFGPGGEAHPAACAARALQHRRRHPHGAARSARIVAGEWNGMHIEPVDPRSTSSAPVVLLYPYGIVVDRSGRRFFDEGGGLVHETWEWFSRHSILRSRAARPTRSSTAGVLDDRRTGSARPAPRCRRSRPIRSTDWRKLIGVDAAVSRRPSRPTTPPAPAIPRASTPRAATGLRPRGTLEPPKSNWARAISEPPFLAWPLIGASPTPSAGLRPTTARACCAAARRFPASMRPARSPGISTRTAPNAVSVLRAFVFGRIAGREAVASAHRR